MHRDGVQTNSCAGHVGGTGWTGESGGITGVGAGETITASVTGGGAGVGWIGLVGMKVESSTDASTGSIAGEGVGVE